MNGGSDKAANHPPLHQVSALLVLLACLATGCASIRRPLPEAITVNPWKLPNGLTVYPIENHSVPLVTLDVWVRVGSHDEPSEVAGVSHYLEHMLFKGTPRLGVGDYDRRIEELGGYLNAATSSDYTHYYMTLPSEHLERALEDMADVLQNSSIDAGEVERERSVILEEIRQKQDNPVGFLFDEVTRRTYASGPYAGTVIGSAETVGGMTRDQLREHYQRFYAPQNMALVISGDIVPVQAKPLVEKYFGGFDRKVEPWRAKSPETVFSPPESLVWERDQKQTYLFVTFPGVAARDVKTLATLDVTENLLFGGRSARLVNVLREKKRLVTSISSMMISNREPGFLGLYATCDPKDLEAIRDALFEELDDLRRSGPSGSELRRARRQAETDHLYHAETNTGKASIIGYSFAMLGTAALATEYEAAVASVTEDDVHKLLSHMTRDRASFHVARPRVAEPAAAQP